MMSQREADRRSGTWLTCWECGDWYGPQSEAKQRTKKEPSRVATTDDRGAKATSPMAYPACPKCGGFL